MNLILPVFSMLIIVLLLFVFFTKDRVSSEEPKIYGFLLILSFFNIIFNICGIYIGYFVGIPFFLYILNHFDLPLYLMFGSLLLLYLLYVYYKDNSIDLYIKLKKIILFFDFLFVITTFFLPVNIEINEVAGYAYGLCVNFVYLISGIYLGLCILVAFCLLFKRVSFKKTIPIFSLIILGGFAVLIQRLIPSLIVIPSVMVFVELLMYFTIENPDVKMIEQLQVARDQAEKANRAKTDFLSSMSHEIRTPLNAIVGFSDCIMEADSLDEAKENAHDIVNASQTLLEIVNGILDISKIEAGKIEIVNSSYNANEVFSELAKLITPKMKEKGLDFSFNIAEDLPATLYGDHANLKKVITNLLSNACKYTDRGFVHYEVNCVNSKDVCKLIISVEDSGRGIKNENIDKMFTKFQRLDVDRNTTIEGTGLGLAITKQLMELMGGRIIVHTVYGEGSKFTVVVNQKIEKVEVLNTKKVKTSLDLQDVKILLVDDTELNLKVASKILERYNANMVECCDSGYNCLEKVKSGNEYDLILLDDMMPKMSGIETLNELKKIPGFNIPTIALTANAISGMREKYIEDGFDDYLAKPIEKEQLIHVINQVLGRSITEKIEVLETSEMDDNNYLTKNGVNLDYALSLLGDMEMYNMTISDFLSEVENKWKRINEYKNTGNMKDYSIEVHSLKSDCKYLGFMELADISYKHELKSKENNFDYVNDNFKRLEDEYKRVLNVVKTYVKDNSL